MMSGRSSRRARRSPRTGTYRWIRHTACRDSTTRFSRGESPAMGACTMGALKALALVLLMGAMGASALAQGPTYGVGRTPTAEEIRALDISIGPEGKELPP